MQSRPSFSTITVSQPFIRGFGQLIVRTGRHKIAGRERGDGGASTEIVGRFPNARSPGRLQSRLQRCSREYRTTYGTVISKRHKKEEKKKAKPVGRKSVGGYNVKVMKEGWTGIGWGRPRPGEHFCCELAFLTCQTPTTALAIKMSRMTNGSTNAVIESSSSSKKAKT